MQYIIGTREFQIEEPTAVTIGKFDGLHRGHMKLLDEVFRFRKAGMKTAVFTFETAPGSLMSGRMQTMITTNEERRRNLEQAGIDYLVEYPFNTTVAHMSPEDFVRKVLTDQMHARAVIAGTDCSFGYKGAGNAALLRKLGPEYGFRAVIVDKLMDGDREISSTYVREELAAGHIRKANELLGYEYSISGEVVHGQHLGSTLGFPTANILPPAQKHLPVFGVYLSETEVDGVWYPSLTNIGRKPTIEGLHPVSAETFLYDFDQSIYGKSIEVRMLDFFRPEMKFDSLNQLRAQVDSDKVRGRQEHEKRNRV
ncbi:MAG: bifunctional riboflavin kinase/FAD synthetase [Clostridium sp.]|nr:bifunctional riboflavin kinase/FAD synthetase [Clostridium sp.]